MKKTISFLILIVLCFVACKKEPDLPDDPHVSLINSFIGVWSVEGEYWQFKTDGTGGRAGTATGPFPNTFSFFVYAGQDVQTAPSEGDIVLLNDSGEDIDVTRYEFLIVQNQAVLTVVTYTYNEETKVSKREYGSPITLQWVSGAPYPLSLTNPLIGEWSAQWNGSHGDNQTWSLKYRDDGTVKLYHHGMHQFENGYALRGNTLVIFGLWRFQFNPIVAEIQTMGNSKWQVNETQAYPPTADWVYTKVTSAEWRE